QRGGDVGLLRVRVDEGGKCGLDARNVAGVDVGIADLAGYAVHGGAAGGVSALGRRTAGRGSRRRPGNVNKRGTGTCARWSRRLVRDVEELKRDRAELIAGQLDEQRFRNDRVGKVGRELGVRIVQVGELQRKHVTDDLLRVGRELHGRL